MILIYIDCKFGGVLNIDIYRVVYVFGVVFWVIIGRLW